MITHFLGAEEVRAYLRDFSLRLDALGDAFPQRWISLGESGEKLSRAAFDLLPPARAETVALVSAHVDKATGSVRFESPISAEDLRGANPLLVIDSAIHSGSSMLRLIDELARLGASDIITYSLMMKRSSAIVPTYFGLVVDDTDRVYFQLDRLPNHRLSEKRPFGTLRELSEQDIDKEILPIGKPFEGITVGTLLYGKRAAGYRPYGYQVGGDFAGIVSFGLRGSTLFVDSLGTATSHRKRGIGDALLRWAETWARSNKCSKIELWAFEPAIEVYEYFGYGFVDDATVLFERDQKFRMMSKKILYHLRPDGIDASS